MSAADIPPVVSSILKKKSNVGRAIDSNSRHTMETSVNPDGNATKSIVKRKTPSTKSLVTVPVLPENRFAYRGKVYEHEDRFADEGEYRAGWNKYEREHPEELNEINADANRYENEANYVSKYAFNAHPDRSELDEQMRYNVKNRKKQKKGHKEFKGKKSAFPEDTPIYDASFREVTDSSKFRKAPVRDARELGLATKSKAVEPAGIAAISANKRKVKSELLNFNPIKPSKPARNNRNGDDWLIDEAFEHVAKAGKAIVKAGKATGKVAGKAIKEGFQATKKGIQGFNELSDEVVKNPMLIRMGQAHEATLHGMASQRRHALGSIAATGKKSMSAGSLVKQHGFVSHTNATIAPQTATGLRVITKIVRRGNRDEVLYFLENGRQVTRNQARLIQEGIMPPTLTNNASTTTAKAYQTYNTNPFGIKSRENPFSLKKKTNPVLNAQKVAQATNYENEDIGKSVETVAKKGNPIGEITRKTTASGIVTRAKNGLGATKMSNNPVLRNS